MEDEYILGAMITMDETHEYLNFPRLQALFEEALNTPHTFDRPIQFRENDKLIITLCHIPYSVRPKDFHYTYSNGAWNYNPYRHGEYYHAHHLRRRGRVEGVVGEEFLDSWDDMDIDEHLD